MASKLYETGKVTSKPLNQMANAHVWDLAPSERGNEQLAPTNKENLKKAAKVVEYWMRTKGLSEKTIQSVHLVDIMVKYYHIARFAWDSKRAGLVLSGDVKDRHKVWELSSGEDWGSVCSENVLSTETTSTAQWEVTVREHPIRYAEGLYMMMGYIDAGHIGEFDRTSLIGCNSHEVALYIADGMTPRVRTDSKWREIHEEWKYAQKIGDKFRLDFDFEKGECAAFLNDVLIGPVSTALPSKIYLCLSLCHRKSELETTLFTSNHRM